MSFIDGLRHRAYVLLHRAEYERWLEDEMRFHLSVDADQQSDSDAARRRFGNVTYLMEETRRIAGLSAGDAVFQDARYMLRHDDGTLYSCLSGVAFAGPRAGDRLRPIPTLTSDWGTWMNLYPHAVAYQVATPGVIPSGVRV